MVYAILLKVIVLLINGFENFPYSVALRTLNHPNLVTNQVYLCTRASASTTASAIAIYTGTSTSTNTYTIRSATVDCQASRRDVCSSFVTTGLVLVNLFAPNGPSLAISDNANVYDDDLTTRMFNPDGSLKDGIESEVKYRNVNFRWDESDEISAKVHKDGVDENGTNFGSRYVLSYQYPMRWSDGKDGDSIFFDRSEGINAKAAKGITVYQAPGKVDVGRLQKASTIGVAKAIEAPTEFSRLFKADVVSGRTVERGSQIYYEFDMAAAPDTCGESKENLGLGFCPYDDLFLISATVLNDHLYCMVVECDSTKIWKVESKELKRIRSTFRVEEAV